MRKVIKNKQELETAFSNLQRAIEKEPLILDVVKLTDKSTDKQLRSVWMLISLIRLHLIDNGETSYTNEDIMNYFKIKAGLFKEKDNVKIPLSISYKAKRTKQEMEMLINSILEYGVEMGWEDIELDEGEMKSLLEYYN